MSKHDNGTGNMQQPTMPPQQAVPPNGWTQKNDFGFLGFDSTPAGRLVRLADVVRWLEDAKCLPRSSAIQAVIDALPEDVMTWLYRIKPDQMAKLVPSDCAFNQATEASIAAENARQWNANLQQARSAVRAPDWGSGSGRFNALVATPTGRIGTQKSVTAPVTPGRPALLQYLGKWVSVKSERTIKGERIDTLDSRPDLIAYLAIPHAKAAEVWDWGRAADVVPLRSPEAEVSEPTTWPELVAFRKNNPTSNWSVKQKGILANEVARQKNAPGAKGVAKAMAAKLGMTVTRLNDLIKTKDDPSKRQKKAA